MEIVQLIIGGSAATLVWFIIGAIVYMNPFVAKIYEHYEDDPSVKNRKDVKTFIINTFLYSVFIQSFLFAFIYLLIQPVLPGTVLMNTIYFGMILVIVKTIPRFFDMYVQSKYPTTLLFIELINGSIGSFVIAGVLALLL